MHSYCCEPLLRILSNENGHFCQVEMMIGGGSGLVGMNKRRIQSSKWTTPKCRSALQLTRTHPALASWPGFSLRDCREDSFKAPKCHNKGRPAPVPVSGEGGSLFCLEEAQVSSLNFSVILRACFFCFFTLNFCDFQEVSQRYHRLLEDTSSPL